MNDSLLAMGGPKIGIVGAGLSGLMAGRILQERGADVTLFDKSRRPGGRANTREHGSYRFDHGAQFFTVRDPAVRGYLTSWIEKGAVAEWAGRLVRIKAGEVDPAKESLRYVGTPGMITLSADLAEGLDVRVDARIDSLHLATEGWRFGMSTQEPPGPFDAVVVALPAPQAVPLLAHSPEIQARADEVVMDPCWAGMYVFDEPLALEFDGAFIPEGPLSWVARDSSKPGRPEVEAWVLHASPDWTRRTHLMDGDQAAAALLDVFRASLGSLPTVSFQRAHRWAYAQAEGAVSGGALYDPKRRIGACGDWCMGGRVEGALLSGMALADRILPVTSIASESES